MRHLKKLLAVIVAICVLATFTVPAFAQDVKTDAEICEILGILKGTTSGVDAEYLAKGTTRIQAVILSLRLADKEEEAYEFEGTDNFADANEVQWAEGQKALAYVKAHPELGWVGSTSGKFFPYEAATPQMIYKVLLEVLGYKQDVDFTWGETLEFAAQVGLVKVADVSKMTNNDMAIAIVEALQTKVKDSEKTLIETLVEAGVISAEKAAEVGLIAGELTVSVAATGAKKLTVSFNRAVDPAKATIAVKKGTVTVNTDKIEFAEDKKSAVITTVTNLTEGEYTVTVSGLTEEPLSATVKVQNEKVTEIKVAPKAPRLGDTGPNAKKAKVTYEVLNQYGEKMTGVSINWTISTGEAPDSPDTTKCTFNIVAAGGNDFIPGSIVYITGVHASSGTVVNTSVEVVLPAKADSLAFKGVYDTTKSKLADLPAGFADDRWVLLYEVIDQYGNKIDDPDFSDIVFTSDNPLFVASTFSAGPDVTIDGVKYEAVELDPGSAVNNGGTVTIKAISVVTGKTSTYTITAEAVAQVKEFTMSAPAGIIAEGEKVEIPYSAVDQYGNAVTSYAALNSAVTFTAGQGTLEFEKQNDGSAKLIYTAPLTGADDDRDLPVYLTSLVSNGGNHSSLMITVKEKARPVAIIGLDADKGTKVAKGNYVDILAEDLIIQDQYGRVMSDDDVNNWINESSANSIVVASDNAETTAFKAQAGGSGGDLAEIVLAGENDFVRLTAAQDVTASTEAITFKLATGNDGSGKIDSSAKVITFTKIEQSQYVSFEVGDLGLMYNNAKENEPTDSKYNKTVKVYGVLADGTKVLLPASDYTVSFGDAKLDYAKDGSTTIPNVLTDMSLGGYKEADFQEDGKDIDIKVTLLITVEDQDSGAALDILEKELVISKAAPKAATVELIDEVKDGAAVINPTTDGTIDAERLKAFIKGVKDQYGVDWTEENPVITITKLVKTEDSAFKVSDNGTADAKITGAILGDKFTATFKYASGVSVSIDFTVGKAAQ